MASKSLLRWGFKADAERISERIRDAMGISKFAPLDAFDLAKHLDVPVTGVKELQEDLTAENYSILRNPNKFSAMWMPNENGDKVIIHNDFHSAKRQQSNLMHELAHVILEHKIPDKHAKLCHTLGLHYYNVEHEQEAKYLGGSLQITRPGLLWALKNYTVEEISDHYNASVDMVNYRIRVTGVLKQRAKY
jgi:Zn-dependent peptidase ImmA (M78 family)